MQALLILQESFHFRMRGYTNYLEEQNVISMEQEESISLTIS